MFLNIAFVLIPMLASAKVFANTSLLVHPSETKSLCKDSGLYVSIQPLIRVTRSKTQLVKLSTASVGLCEAARQYLVISKPISIAVTTKIDKVDYPIKYNPCFRSTMEICTAVYREAMVETIGVRFKQLELSNRVEIPGTQRDRIVKWDSKDCPPYHPDCDL